MDITNTFAKARNANYVEPLKRLVVVLQIPEHIKESGWRPAVVSAPMTMWIEQSTLDELDAAIDQGPFIRVGGFCDPKKVVGPHGIYGEDAPGRYVGSSGIYRVQGGALVTFEYM